MTNTNEDSESVVPRARIGFVPRVIGALVLGSAFVTGAFAASFVLIGRDLPELLSLEDYRPPRTTHIYDRSGHIVGRIATERRTVVPIARIPPHVKNAFLAAEDADFYEHEGLDYFAIVAAILNEVKVKIVGGNRRGGSTITQQTAKTFLLSSERSYSRKVKEMILAMRIEEELTKEEILHLYLNQIYFGHGAYGVEEAARTYYGRGVEKLTLSQAACLASVPKWPNRINPFADTERLEQRRAYVLGQMEEHGHITAKEREAALKEPVRIDVTPLPYLDVAPYFAEAVRLQLVEQLGEAVVTEGGLSVYTALDAKMQKTAVSAVRDGLREVDKRQGYRGPLVRLDPDEAKALTDALDEERARRFTAEKTPELASPELVGRPLWDLRALDAKLLREDPKRALDAVRGTRAKIGAEVGAIVKRIDAAGKRAVVDLGTLDGVLTLEQMKWARPFHPVDNTKSPRSPGDVLKEGDIVLVRVTALVPEATDAKGKKTKAMAELALEQDPLVEGAFVAVDPHTHRLLAMVGGYDFTRSNFNRATQARRQPGSSFKPFIYALGIENRAFTPVGRLDEQGSHLITDAPKVFLDRWTGKKWNPKNSGGGYKGDITLRTCLTFSVNTCSITLIETLGVEPVLDLATRAGLRKEPDTFAKNLTLALGTSEVTLTDLIGAYAIFPGEGLYAPPVLVEKVKAPDGEILFEAKVEPVRVISPETAFVMSDMMKSVVETGTATAAKKLGRTVAGKTGTTNNARSVWFVGFTPDLLAGAYVGFDDNRAMGNREYGGKAALPIWLKFMSEAVVDLPDRDFTMPDGVVKKVVDTRTGLLVHAEDPIDEAAEEFKDVFAAAVAVVMGEAPEDPDALPPSEEGVLPPGQMNEVFIRGTEPVLTVEDAPPPPLELLELQGGLAP
jgi:penicillin-binding protein 1A